MNHSDVHYVLFVNPTSGKGSGPRIAQTVADSLRSLSNIKCTIVHTLYSGYVADYLSHLLPTNSGTCVGGQQEHDVNTTSVHHGEKTTTVLIGVGGDGIMYEIVNALQWQSESQQSEYIIGEVPAGSGNGVFASLANESGHTPSVNTAISWLLQGRVRPLDLLYVNNLNKYLRLGVAWGLIADLDLRTEWLRCLGSTRFTVGAAYYILRKKTYQGRLVYEKCFDTNASHEARKTPHTEEVCGNFVYVWACNTSHGSTDVHCAPGALSNDGYIHISYIVDTIENPISRVELAKILLAMESGRHIHHPLVHSVRTRQFCLYMTNGLLTLDGETCDTHFVSVSVHPKKLRMLC